MSACSVLQYSRSLSKSSAPATHHGGSNPSQNAPPITHLYPSPPKEEPGCLPSTRHLGNAPRARCLSWRPCRAAPPPRRLPPGSGCRPWRYTSAAGRPRCRSGGSQGQPDRKGGRWHSSPWGGGWTMPGVKPGVTGRGFRVYSLILP